MRTLLGHLAQFASFSTQGEVLCTQALAYLLQDPDASQVLAAEIGIRADAPVADNLAWRAEAHQDDTGRPDLEACSTDGVPVVKVEAKLGAAFGAGQLQSYANDLGRRSGSGILVVLVPRHRVAEASQAACQDLGLSGDGPWRSPDHPGVAVTVVSWDDTFGTLRQVASGSFSADLLQCEAMYRVLSGSYIEPLASRDELIAWREREGVFVNLVDRVTRQITPGPRVLPMDEEPLPHQPEDLDARGYRRRYVCRPLGSVSPCFSIGVRDPFSGHDTPIWLRFHRDTPGFAVIRARLTASHFAPRIVDSEGHVWIPLDVPVEVDGDLMVDALVGQAEAIARVAYEPRA